MTSSLAQQQSDSQFSFNSSSAKFISLDLDQQNSVYSLYAASAAAAAAAAAAVNKPFSSLFGGSSAPCLTFQSFNDSVQLLSDIEKKELTLKNLLSPFSSISHNNNNNNNLISIGSFSNAEIINKQNTGLSNSFVPCFIDNNIISPSLFNYNSALPKSNSVRIAKSDYLNVNQQISSTTASDSEGGHSSSGSNSSSPQSIFTLSSNNNAQEQVKVIVGGEASSTIAGTSNVCFSTPLCDNSSISSRSENNSHALSSSPSSSVFNIQANNLPESNDTLLKTEETIRGKKRKELVRDDAYWERRRKNNDAAKRSRDSRRRKEDEIAIKAAILEQENLRLRFEIEKLKSEIERYRLITFNNNNSNNNNNNNNNNNKNNNKQNLLQDKEPLILNVSTSDAITTTTSTKNKSFKSDNHNFDLIQRNNLLLTLN